MDTVRDKKNLELLIKKIFFLKNEKKNTNTSRISFGFNLAKKLSKIEAYETDILVKKIQNKIRNTNYIYSNICNFIDLKKILKKNIIILLISQVTLIIKIIQKL